MTDGALHLLEGDCAHFRAVRFYEQTAHAEIRFIQLYIQLFAGFTEGAFCGEVIRE